MELEDRPRPGRDMLVFFNAVVGGILLLVICITILKKEYNAETITGLILTAVVCGVVYWFGFSHVYGTVYRIGAGGLELRCGILKTFIRYERILEIVRVDSWRRMFLHGIGYQNFSNRLGNFVELKLKGQSVFLSPSDPEKFVKLIREHMVRD